jgi:hypothetical protein
MQGLAQEIKATLTNTHAASSTAAPDQAAKHKKLLQDFATILQVSRSAGEIWLWIHAATLGSHLCTVNPALLLHLLPLTLLLA